MQPINSAKDINQIIKDNKIETNGISDGYHTFAELYEARIVLFMALCRQLDYEGDACVWMSKKHSDGSEWEGWFLLGIGKKPGEQITYHLPISKWDECLLIALNIEKAPEFDGHTSSDVLERLKKI